MCFQRRQGLLEGLVNHTELHFCRRIAVDDGPEVRIEAFGFSGAQPRPRVLATDFDGPGPYADLDYRRLANARVVAVIGAIERQGLTLVPLEMYFKRGIAKVVLALGKGKKLHDKRDTERERDAVREIARAVRTR